MDKYNARKGNYFPVVFEKVIFGVSFIWTNDGNTLGM